MRVAFVLSKKMFTMVSFGATEEFANGSVVVALTVRGPSDEIHKMIKLLKKIIQVMDADLADTEIKTAAQDYRTAGDLIAQEPGIHGSPKQDELQIKTKESLGSKAGYSVSKS